MKRFAKSHHSLWETQALPQCNFSHQLIGTVAAFLTHSESLYEEIQNYTEVTRKKEQLLLKVQMILPPHTPPTKKGKEKVWAFLSISMSLILEIIALTLHMALTRESPAQQTSSSTYSTLISTLPVKAFHTERGFRIKVSALEACSLPTSMLSDSEPFLVLIMSSKDHLYILFQKYTYQIRRNQCTSDHMAGENLKCLILQHKGSLY